MSNREYPLYTIKNNCQDCYKCVRRCPVKAIKIEDGSAMIVPDLCIACGTCYRVCPAKAKQARNDLTRAKHLVQSGKDVYVSLAPSWITEFEGVSREQMIAAIRRLGFRGVSETALGAEEVSANIAGLLDKAANDALQVSAAPDMSQTACGEKDEDASAERSPERTSGVREDTDTGEATQVSAVNRLFISTACPAVVEYINKYVPERTANLTKLTSPLLAHCRLLKTALGKDIEVIFIGPCIAKKIEADRHPDLLSLSLSFTDLRQWLKDENIELKDIHTSVFDKFVMSKAEEGTAYPVEGGMIETLKPYEQSQKAYLMQITGIDNIKRELKNIREEALDRPVFIECLACEGGCVNGPCIREHAERRLKGALRVDTFAGGQRFDVAAPDTISHNYPFLGGKKVKFGSEAINDMLYKMGKTSPEKELNCGSCGYPTCRDKAVAILEGKAKMEMCLPFLKEKAESFSDTIINNTPNAIIVMDEDLVVQQINRAAVRMFKLTAASDILHEHVVRILNPAEYQNIITSALHSTTRSHYLAEYQLYVEETILYDRQYHIVITILRDVTERETLRGQDETLRRQTVEIADRVIDKQMRVVQEIASLLGETTAETKIALTRLKDAMGHE